MSFFERIEELVFWAVTSLCGAVAAGVAWLIRRVLTNQKQIEMLQQSLAHRDQLRVDDRKAMDEVREGVEEIKSMMMHAGFKHRGE